MVVRFEEETSANRTFAAPAQAGLWELGVRMTLGDIATALSGVVDDPKEIRRRHHPTYLPRAEIPDYRCGWAADVQLGPKASITRHCAIVPTRH